MHLSKWSISWVLCAGPGDVRHLRACGRPAGAAGPRGRSERGRVARGRVVRRKAGDGEADRSARDARSDSRRGEGSGRQGGSRWPRRGAGVGQLQPAEDGGQVQIDCSITKGYNSNGSPEFWALDKDARLRLWPAGSPLVQPGTFVYPAKQRWFAGLTQMANEPVYVDGGERPQSQEDLLSQRPGYRRLRRDGRGRRRDRRPGRLQRPGGAARAPPGHAGQPALRRRLPARCPRLVLSLQPPERDRRRR